MPAMNTYKQITALISTTLDIIEAYETIKGLCGLPEAFQEVSKWLPLVEKTLRGMMGPAKHVASADDALVLESSLTSCEKKADNLLEIFQRISKKSKDDEYDPSVYRTIAIRLGKHRVETLMDAILEDLEVLVAHHIFEVDMQGQVEPLALARKELAKTNPSLDDADLDEQHGGANQYGDNNSQFNNLGPGTQKNVKGHYFEGGSHQFAYRYIKHKHIYSKSSTPQTYRVIPLPRNEDITDRADIFAHLNTLLPPKSENQSAALYGLGGSGKTQIALEYAYRRCRDQDWSVFWVQADNETTFTQGYKAIARAMGIGDGLDGEKLLVAVREGIEKLPRWLLVLDNADDLRLFGIASRASADTPYRPGEEPTRGSTSFRDFLPQGATGTMLWTSRDGGIVGPLVGEKRGLFIGRMSIEEAMKLFGKWRGEETNSEEADDARRLVEELQWLPLAISQAGAYLRKTSMPIREYLSRLTEGKERWRILKRTEHDRHRLGVPNSVLETWSISIERIRQDNEMAYKILHVIAYVNNQSIPFAILTAAGLLDAEEWEAPSREDEERVLDAVARLKDFAFIGLQLSEGKARHIYEMHKLVQEATRYGLSKSTDDEMYFSRAALQIVTSLFPGRHRKKVEEYEEYVAHAVAVGEWAATCEQEEAASELLDRVSDYLYDRGRWREREPVDGRILELRQQALGEEHPDTIRSMANLATTYHAQGRYDEDEEISTRVLELRRKALGEEHPDTISSMADLATTYNTQGRYDEAETIRVKVLELRRKALGEEHPDTISSMADLATTYHAQGRYDEAETIRVKVLELRRKALGEEHPDTVRSMADLAMTCNAQGRWNYDSRHWNQGILILALGLALWYSTNRLHQRSR
ncbi:hypothetical protein BFJ66_g1033 [Fusarium oxysporum f. sp. cepae]|nr:hypothetical protein BFJ66_g1033 [Fusarium oxysporum f. sp. cepae]